MYCVQHSTYLIWDQSYVVAERDPTFFKIVLGSNCFHAWISHMIMHCVQHGTYLVILAPQGTDQWQTPHLFPQETGFIWDQMHCH
jgi:hypothetical protein